MSLDCYKTHAIYFIQEYCEQQQTDNSNRKQYIYIYTAIDRQKPKYVRLISSISMAVWMTLTSL